MKKVFLLCIFFPLSGCSVFEAILEGFAALLEANADQPRFAYGIDDLENPEVKIATLTEEDLGLPLRRITYEFAAGEVFNLRFNGSQEFLAVNYLEYFSDGQDAGLQIVETESGLVQELQTDNTLSTGVTNNCGAPYQSMAETLLEALLAEFPFSEGTEVNAFWEIVDSPANNIFTIGWASNTQLVVGYQFEARFGYILPASGSSDLLSQEEINGSVLLEKDASDDWNLVACDPPSPPPQPTETRELRAGDPTGLTLDGAPVLSVLSSGAALEVKPVGPVTRWID